MRNQKLEDMITITALIEKEIEDQIVTIDMTEKDDTP